MKQGLIFDLDGTLLDTLKDLAASTNYVLRAHGFPEHPLEDYNYLVGQGARHLIEHALPAEARDKKRVDKLLEEFSAYYGTHWDVHTRPYPGVPEMLQKLKSMKRPVGILSNKPHAFTVMCVEKLLPDFPFSIVMGHKEPFPRKPDPAAAWHIAEQWGLKPADIMFCGDTSIDMTTADRAGMFAVGVTWGFRPREELLEHGARELAETPLDIPKIFKKS